MCFQSGDGSEGEELINGELDGQQDATDSEHEEEGGASSDHEQDVRQYFHTIMYLS